MVDQATSFVTAQDAQQLFKRRLKMRELTLNEMSIVSGAGDECPSGGGNDIVGVTDSESLGRDLVNIYEGIVSATSHIIERIANAL